MTVAIDVGNGALKLAWVADGRVGRVERLPTIPVPDPATLAERIAGLIPDATADGRVTAVSVVPAVTRSLREAATALGLDLLLADAASIPLPTRVPRPSRLGADRLLGAWGALGAHGTPCIVVDLGTATTVDAVAPDGAFVGGAIMPGMALGASALARGTAQLPGVELAMPDHAIGEDTLAALRSGIVLGHLGAIREVVARVAAELTPGGPRPTVVVTGGLSAAPWMHDALLADGGPGFRPIADAVDPHLLLRALGDLATRDLATRSPATAR